MEYAYSFSASDVESATLDSDIIRAMNQVSIYVNHRETSRAPHPHLDVSGLDICHRLPCRLHEGQEVEFLRAAPAVDPVQEIQVSGRLGQGLGPAGPGARRRRACAGRARGPARLAWGLASDPLQC